MAKTEKELLSKKELLELFVKHRVHSPFPGDWDSVFKGLGYEFWGLRELETTDPFRNIDWKAKAKTGKYYVREYLAESSFNVMLLYDISRSVRFGRKELLQAHIAVSLAYSAVLSNDGCGLILFAETSPGRWQIADSIQQSLQNTLTAQYATDRSKINYASLNRLITPYLNAADTIDPELQRDRTRAAFDPGKMGRLWRI